MVAVQGPDYGPLLIHSSNSTKMTVLNFKIGHRRFQVHPANFVVSIYTTLYYVIDTISLKPFTTNEYVHYIVFYLCIFNTAICEPIV
jgi:hypothetical protein